MKPVEVDNEKLEKLEHRWFGSVSIKSIPGVGEVDIYPVSDLFKHTPSFLCCRLIDVQNAGSFDKVHPECMQRAVRLPEGTQYCDENGEKTAGPGGVFIVQKKNLVLYEGDPNFHFFGEERYVGYYEQALEAGDFYKKFALERKEDASQKDVENTVRFIKAEKNKKHNCTLASLRETLVLGLLLRRSKIHQRGRISIPVYDYPVHEYC